MSDERQVRVFYPSGHRFELWVRVVKPVPLPNAGLVPFLEVTRDATMPGGQAVSDGEMVACDPRGVIQDVATGEVLYEPRAHLAMLDPSMVEWLHDNPHWPAVTGIAALAESLRSPGGVVPRIEEWQGRFTPDMARESLEAIQYLLRTQAREMAALAEWRFRDRTAAALLVANLTQALAGAECLLWRNDIYDAAQRGADVFVGQPMPSAVGPLSPQFWCWEHAIQFTGDVLSGGALWDLAVPCSLMAMIVSPVRGIRTDGALSGRRGMLWGIVFAPQPGTTPGNLPILRFLPTRFDGEECLSADAPIVAAAEFLKQPFVQTAEVPLRRGERRRRERKQQSWATVRTVILRPSVQESTKAHAAAGREWACQWLVKGHWRRQWYGRAQEHRPRWILPYVKGDSSKPLKTPSNTVFAVVR